MKPGFSGMLNGMFKSFKRSLERIKILHVSLLVFLS